MTAGLIGCATTTTPSPTEYQLYSAGPKKSDPAIIRYVNQDSPLSKVINKGDILIAIDGHEIKTFGDYWDFYKKTAKSATVLSKDGIKKAFDAKAIGKSVFMYDVGETLVDEDGWANAGTGHSIIIASAALWESDFKFLEVVFGMSTANGCKDCQIKNLGAMDWQAKSWLQPVKLLDVAWALYPPLDVPPQPINIPPPVPVQYIGSATTTGTVRMHGYGNYATGTYYGYTTSNVTPQYDYTLTNIAMLHNLSSTIQSARIKEQNEKDQEKAQS